MSTQKMPTYPEMLLMNENDLEKWILLRIKPMHRKKLIQEMILHEEKNQSMTNGSSKEIKPEVQLILDLFDKNKSLETLKLFEKIKIETGIDLAGEAMMAKTATDFCKLHH